MIARNQPQNRKGRKEIGRAPTEKLPLTKRVLVGLGK